MIIDGRTIAKEIREETRARALGLARPPSFLAVAVAPSPATESYLKMKREQASADGIHMEVHTYEETTTDELVQLLQTVTEDAIIVQLPLPPAIDTRKVLDSIPLEKDADVLGTQARERAQPMHPVAAAIKEIVKRGGIDPSGKRATVIGSGWLVGSPAAAWLRLAGAVVTVVTLEEGDLREALADADIVVSGAGVAGLIKKEDIKPGAAVIDIGTSELGGTIAGDVDPSVGDVAGLMTPVPGGVGPVTVAFLLQNVVALAEAHSA